MYQKNEIEDFITELESSIKRATEDKYKVDQLLRLQKIAAAYHGEDELVTSTEIYEQMKNRPPENKIMTGYTKLDNILGGFREKQLIVLSAATKSGKTSLCIELTVRLKDYNPAWLPFEEPAEELIQKFLDHSEAPPYFVTPQRMIGNRLAWVEKKIIEAKAKYDSKIIFIDHLHFIVEMGENMSVQIGKTMRELKQIAKRWNIIIVLIAHLIKTRMDLPPTLEDIRDSSFIAQEADTVILLWRQTKINNGNVEITDNVNLSVQANRRTGKTGNVEMIFSNGRFLERAWELAEEMDF